MLYAKPSYRDISPLYYAFIVINGVTIIETPFPGVYHVVGEDYSLGSDSAKCGENQDELGEWPLVKRIYSNRGKIPKRGQFFTLRTYW